MARTIPRAAVDEFTRQLNLVSESMREKLTDQLMQIDFSAPGAIDVVKDLMQTYCGAATDSAALLAAQFYDAAREYSIGEGMDAVAEWLIECRKQMLSQTGSPVVIDQGGEW